MIKQNVLIIGEHTIIALKHIESIHYGCDTTNELVDALKDDKTFDIVTISGARYTISVNEQMATFSESAISAQYYMQYILEKWTFTLG